MINQWKQKDYLPKLLQAKRLEVNLQTSLGLLRKETSPLQEKWQISKTMKNYLLTLSLNFSCGTGTPHLRSLVIQRGFNPPLSHPWVAWIAFWLQDPATDMSLIYTSNLSFSSGSSRNKWFVSRIWGVFRHTC